MGALWGMIEKGVTAKDIDTGLFIVAHFVDTPIALLNKPDGVFRGIW